MAAAHCEVDRRERAAAGEQTGVEEVTLAGEQGFPLLFVGQARPTRTPARGQPKPGHAGPTRPTVSTKPG